MLDVYKKWRSTWNFSAKIVVPIRSNAGFDQFLYALKFPAYAAALGCCIATEKLLLNEEDTSF